MVADCPTSGCRMLASSRHVSRECLIVYVFVDDLVNGKTPGTARIYNAVQSRVCCGEESSLTGWQNPYDKFHTYIVLSHL